MERDEGLELMEHSWFYFILEGFTVVSLLVDILDALWNNLFRLLQVKDLIQGFLENEWSDLCQINLNPLHWCSFLSNLWTIKIYLTQKAICLTSKIMFDKSIIHFFQGRIIHDVVKRCIKNSFKKGFPRRKKDKFSA